MNEKLQYATMLEIHVSTCNVTFKPTKKKRFKRAKKVDHEIVKKQLVEKVNAEENLATLSENNEQPVYAQENEILESTEEQVLAENVTEQSATVRPIEKKKRKFGISVIGVQLTVIGLLIATIFLTTAVYPDSGVNVFLRSVFGTEQNVSVDDRTFSDFAPVINLDDGASVALGEDGVMTLTGKGSVYAPCNGTVSAVIKGEDGKFSLEIMHSQNFKSVISGLDYAYADLNDSVYYNIPVGYISAGATMCFTGSAGAVISDYTIVNDTVVWAV